jgi:hypothetical protein
MDKNRIVNAFYELISKVENPSKSESVGKWTISEVVGHLIDSASNNHNRFLRYSSAGTACFPGYDQNECVIRNNYKTMDFKTLCELWYSYNTLILHSLESLPKEALSFQVKVGDFEPVSYQFLIDDYFDHLKAHKLQIKRIIES